MSPSGNLSVSLSFSCSVSLSPTPSFSAAFNPPYRLTLFPSFSLSSRQALRYVIRNTTLPQRMRAQAQLRLYQMHCYTRPLEIKNRCIMGGRGRGVFRAFKMSRVGLTCYHEETDCVGRNATRNPLLIQDLTVCLSNERYAREYTWREESDLVDRPRCDQVLASLRRGRESTQAPKVLPHSDIKIRTVAPLIVECTKDLFSFPPLPQSSGH